MGARGWVNAIQKRRLRSVDKFRSAMKQSQPQLPVLKVDVSAIEASRRENGGPAQRGGAWNEGASLHQHPWKRRFGWERHMFSRAKRSSQGIRNQLPSAGIADVRVRLTGDGAGKVCKMFFL